MMQMWVIHGLICMLALLCQIGAEVPSTLHYQGMFLSKPDSAVATGSLERPVYGRIQKQLTVNIRPFLPGGILDTPVYTTTYNDVLIENGVFNLSIEVPETLAFNQPYAMEVVVLSAGGGSAGVVPLKAVPYTFMARSASNFGGFPASAYARKGHGHDTAQKSFTLDASGLSPAVGQDRFQVINGSEAGVPGFAVFTVDQQGGISKVNLMSFEGNIVTQGGLRVLDSNGRTIVSRIDSDGSAVFRNINFKGVSTTKTLRASGSSVLENLKIENSLTFGPEAALTARPGGQGTANLLGQTHRLEDHASSQVLDGLVSMTNGSTVTAGLHVHTVTDGIFGSKALSPSIVTSDAVLDGSIKDADLATDAQIPDTALSPLQTAGKIAASALPSNLALKDFSNTFGAGFDTGKGGLLETLNRFDRLRSKTLQVVATSSIAGQILFEARSFGNEFRWVLENNGTLSFRRLIGGTAEETRLKIQPSGARATIEFNKFRFENDPNMITGATIQDGTLTGDRILNSSIPGGKLQDGAIGTTALQDGSIATAKIATGAVTADRIADEALGNAQLQDGAVTLTKIANEVLTLEKFVLGTLTQDRIEASSLQASKFEANSIGAEHIQSFSLTADYIADNSIPGTIVKTASIGNENIADALIASREKPVSIHMQSPSTPLISLIGQNSNDRHLDLFSNQGTAGDFSDIKGLEIATQDGQESLAFGLDGRLSVKSSHFTTVVTLEPDMLSTALGVTRFGQNTCVQTDYTLIDDQSADTGTGFCFKEQLSPANFESAMATCFADGAELCTLPRTLTACRQGAYTVTNTMLTSELIDTANNGTMHYVTVTVPGGSCSAAGSVTFGNIAAGTNNPAYGCCYKP